MSRGSRIARWSLASALLLFAAGVALAADRVTVPGTSVSLELPADFGLGDGQPSIVSPAGAAVVVLQVPDEQYAPMLNGAMEENFPAPFSKETLEAGGRSYLVYTTTALLQRSTAQQWIAITGPAPTLIINFVQSEVAGVTAVLDAATVRQLLASIELSAPIPPEEQLAAIGVTLDLVAPFRLAGPVLRGLISLEAPGADPAAAGVKAMLITPPAGLPWQSLDEAGREHMAGETSNVLSEPTVFGGADGVRRAGTVSTADDSESFVQFVTKAGSNLVVFALRGPRADMTAEIISAFDQMAASFRLAN